MPIKHLWQQRSPWLALLPLLFALATPGVTLASDEEVRLSVRPVGQTGPYFELTLQPGESQNLEVDLSNDGSAALTVVTYATDVYTLTNGGYGGRLRGEPQTGATTWLSYPTQVFDLGAGMLTRRDFSVAVPEGTTSGEYISSLVLENDQPVVSTGGISLGQIVRQAVAVVVTVPGPRTPEIAIGEASHTIVSGRSVVAIDLDNAGNVRLGPVADFELRDSEGGLVSQSNVAMDTIFSHTVTRLAVPLAALLQPGTYHVTLRLTDVAQGVSVERTDLTFVVGAPPPSTAPLAGPPLTAVNQAPAETKMQWLIVLTLLGAALVVLLAFVLLRHSRRKSA